MGSPSSILTLGLGSWGSVNEIITLGYGIGAAVDLTPGPYYIDALGSHAPGPAVHGSHAPGAAALGNLAE